MVPRAACYHYSRFRISESADGVLRSGKPESVIGSSGKGDGDATTGTDDPCGHAEPVQAEFLELMVVCSCWQNEKLEELSEIVGELCDHEPRPVGDEALAGQMTGADAVLELLDIILGASSGEMRLQNAAAYAPSIGDYRGVEELSDDSLGAFVVRRSLNNHPECPRPAMGVVRELHPLGIFLPGVRLPALSRQRLDGVAKG